MTPFTRLVAASLAALLVVAAAPAALAQDSKSTTLARQLASALEAGKLDCIAAKDPDAPDRFVAALYFPGSLLVVSGRYAAPQLLADRLTRKEYRDVYMDLNGAASPESKIFIQDPGADGLKSKRDDNQAFDIVDIAGKQTMFNSDWKAQKLSEQDYLKTFGDADERYSKILTALLAQLKKTS